jgi:HSP20 family protein
MALDWPRGYLPLREAMDRLFAESFIGPSRTAPVWPAGRLRMTDNDVIVEMAIPGANPQDINVSVTGNALSVSGEVRRERREGEHFDELFRGSFQRSLTLPVEVDAEKTEATYDNGILTIKMPKAAAARARKIEVKPGERALAGAGETEKETVPVKTT